MENQTMELEKEMSLFGQIMQLTDKTMVMDENCLLHQAVMLLADKWTLLILLSLMQGEKRTSDMLRQIADISPKMLVKTLRKLEDAEIVARKVYPVVPPKVEYSLTATGWGLKAVLSSLYNWSVDRSSSLL